MPNVVCMQLGGTGARVVSEGGDGDGLAFGIRAVGLRQREMNGGVVEYVLRQDASHGV